MSTDRSSERKEVIRLNGITILAGLVILANFLTAGFIYRYHAHRLYLENKVHDIEFAGLLQQQHVLHEEIIKLEGVKNWDESMYVRSLKLPEQKN